MRLRRMLQVGKPAPQHMQGGREFAPPVIGATSASSIGDRAVSRWP